MHAIKISSFNGDLELLGLNEFRSWISYGISKIMPRGSIAWCLILARFEGKKIDLVHGFTYQNYYYRQKYHFILPFTENVAWVNKTANCESVLETRHSH